MTFLSTFETWILLALSVEVTCFAPSHITTGRRNVKLRPECPPTAHNNVVVTWGGVDGGGHGPSEKGRLDSDSRNRGYDKDIERRIYHHGLQVSSGNTISNSVVDRAPACSSRTSVATNKKSAKSLQENVVNMPAGGKTALVPVLRSALQQSADCVVKRLHVTLLWVRFYSPRARRILMAAAFRPILYLLAANSIFPFLRPNEGNTRFDNEEVGSRQNGRMAMCMERCRALLKNWLPSPTSAAALWAGCKSGGARVDARSFFFLGRSPIAQERIYSELYFDLINKGSRASESLSMHSIPSFSTFLFSCLAASRLPPGQCDLTREMTDAARRCAIERAEPAICTALQDLPGGMAGEGKLLNIYHLLSKTLATGVPGDVVELGCHKGITGCLMQALLVRDAQQQQPQQHSDRPSASSTSVIENDRARNVCRTLHLFDSFEGLPVGDEAHDPSCYVRAGGAMRASPLDVANNFKECGLPPAQVHVGWFKDSCPLHLPDQINFAHLDGDLYASIKDSLELIYHKLAKGAIVVVDVSACRCFFVLCSSSLSKGGTTNFFSANVN